VKVFRCLTTCFIGCTVSPKAYEVACQVIQELSGRSRGLDCLLENGINPFLIIYACADCGVPLPRNFDRQLLWKHLDALLRTKCWRGLGSARANRHHHRSANADHIPPKFHRKGNDPEGILPVLLRLSYPSLHPPPTTVPDVHKLQIAIMDHKWVAKSQMGTVWYQAGDLYDEDDIACFAAIDSLTRFLPFCRGGILEISTRDIHLMWGVGGTSLGAWTVVQNVCEGYQVKLRPKWTQLSGRSKELDPSARISPEERNTVPPRDPGVVDAVMNGFKRERLDGRAAHRCMMSHLLQVTTTT
jgi:hypothetical protein